MSTATAVSREHFVPIRVTELVEFLATGRGASAVPDLLTEAEQAGIRKLAHALGARLHHDCHENMQRLKDDYAPFDPDADTRTLKPIDTADRPAAIDRMFRGIDGLLQKANYRELTKIEVMQLMKGSSLWGLEMDVAWDVFDRIAIYYRGDVLDKRTIRRWWKLWIREEKLVPEFNRLVLVIKQRPHTRLGDEADVNSIFIKLFKDIPKPDLEMVLPGTRVQLSRFDKGMIFYPVMSGVALVLYKVLADFFGFRDIFAITTAVSLSWSLAIAFAGYGYKSYISYWSKKTAYTLQLTRSLYYQGIDSNAGVFHRILDEAQEQESREALLGYFFLWKRCGTRGATATELDESIEADLEQRLGMKVDFEVSDALEKLLRFGMVRRDGDRYHAVDIDEAIDALTFGSNTSTGDALQSSIAVSDAAMTAAVAAAAASVMNTDGTDTDDSRITWDGPNLEIR